MRAVAVLWVLFYHFFPTIPSKGTYGVLLFFIISGYCISFSAETSQSAWNFYAKRLGRLLPALIVCGFLTTAAKNLYPELIDPARAVRWSDYFYTLISLPTLNFIRRDHVFPDGAYWSLIVEFQFYFACFAIMAIGLRRHLLPVICCIVVVRSLTTSIHQVTFNDFFPFFIAGLSVAAAVKGKINEAIGGMIVAVGVEYYHFWLKFRQPSIPIEFSRSLLLWFGTAAVYLVATKEPRSAALRAFLKPAAFIGLISYPLYLLHQDIGAMIMKWEGIQTDSFGLPVRALGLTGLLLFVAWLVYAFVERPTIRRLTELLSNPLRSFANPKSARSEPAPTSIE